MRRLHPVWMWGLPTHTLIKLDGIALGSLLALGLYTLRLSRRTWFWIGLGAFALGIGAAATVAGGTAFLDSALAWALPVRCWPHGFDRRAQSGECGAAPRAAGLLWAHQLRPLHDAHHGIHFLRLV